MTPIPQPETAISTPSTSVPPDEALQRELAPLLVRSGFSSIDDLGWIRVTGEDRVRWLNGMVTNSIQELKPGHGNYNFLLSAQGRIQGDAHIFVEPSDFAEPESAEPESAESEALLMETALTQISNIIPLLDRFIIMDDVELADLSGSRSGLQLAGPDAVALLSQLFPASIDLAPLQLKALVWRDQKLTLLHGHSPLVPRFELWADLATITALSGALQQAGASVVSHTAFEHLRILEGTPRYGTDIRDRELPQETAPVGTQSRALHFSKGCYLGQEIVERIRSRGNVHRTFTGFRLEGALPPAGTLLEVESKQIGELTSVAAVPFAAGTVQLALGYVRREALERRLPITYPGGTATPTSTPFNLAAAI